MVKRDDMANKEILCAISRFVRKEHTSSKNAYYSQTLKAKNCYFGSESSIFGYEKRAFK